MLVEDSDLVAPRLLNALLCRDDGRVGRIVEVEAYRGVDDAASHARNGMTGRNAPMFGPAGHAYCYFTYGMHWCMNVVTGDPGDGQAVLIRAVEPVAGLDRMRPMRSRARRDVDLTNGPAKLCEAMGIDGSFDGVDLCDTDGPLRLMSDDKFPPRRPGRSTRIGITRDVERRWRWFVTGNPYVSKAPTRKGAR